MGKRYLTIQKKLEELESELKNVINLPPQTPQNQLLSESIDRRLAFVRSLLAAEMESHPSKPQYLLHFDQKLTELEETFHAWDELQTLSPTAATNHPVDDAASTCSCTESCFKDDGSEANEEEEDGTGDHEDADDGDELTVYENPEFVFEDDQNSKEVEEVEGASEDKITSRWNEVIVGELKEEKIRRKRRHGGGRVMKCFLMFGLGLWGVILAYICYTCCHCCDKDEMEGEVFIPHPT